MPGRDPAGGDRPGLSPGALHAAHNIKYEYARTDYESMWPGRKDDHTWPIWRMDLRDVAQLLFR